jgi:hypothetical protein
VAEVSRFPTGRLRVSRIIYFSDLQHMDSREIPVGVVGEVTLPTLRAIGTALRPNFGQAELAIMGPMMREILSRPMDALWPEMVEVFEKGEPGRALDLFAARHCSSLSVLSPAQLEVPRQWLLEKDNEKLAHVVKERMKVTLNDEYFSFLFPPRDGPGVDDPSIKEKVTRIAA